MFFKFSSTVLLLTGLLSESCAAEELEFKGTVFQREGNSISLQVPDAAKQVSLPRFAASIRTINWVDEQGSAIETEVNLKLVPEPEYWVLSWKKVAQDADSIRIIFDSAPQLLSEIKPATSSGDGSILLKACWATTSGEKLRYEPQPYKNTVGYWTKKGDFATWRLKVAKPGKYGVNILQGCGKNQGGSEAKIELSLAGEQSNQLTFAVQETGHFQNFIWRNLGEISIDRTGDFELKISPVEIARAALMDVRAIHLVKLPD